MMDYTTKKPKYLITCCRCVTVKCKGALKDSRETYGKYAYWCGQKRDGWHSIPCAHLPLPRKE